MFVAMGLSAVFPVLHGLTLYGVEQMRHSIGLVWLLSQGALYIVGAAIYAVSDTWPILIQYVADSPYSFEYRSVYPLANLMSGAHLIRFSMYSFLLQRCAISMG